MSNPMTPNPAVPPQWQQNPYGQHAAQPHGQMPPAPQQYGQQAYGQQYGQPQQDTPQPIQVQKAAAQPNQPAYPTVPPNQMPSPQQYGQQPAQQSAQPPYAAPQQAAAYSQTPAPTPAPAPAGPAGDWQMRASKRAGFGTLVAVEFKKLAGTLSDKILLVTGPLFAILITLLVLSSQSNLTTVTNQISPLAYLARIADVILHVTVIKLVAGEWQHRSVQPTLLMQPSRQRYALAQAVVVFTIWLGAALLEIALFFPLIANRAAAINHGYLLDQRVGWVIAVALLGTGLTMAVALVTAMLLPNAAASITVYVLVVLGMMILVASLPDFMSYIDPVQPMMALAGTAEVTNTASVITSSVMLVGLLGLGMWNISRREAG
ncbi:hypothetical protein WEH80_23555 [Actinomycetes bacterium KLBMP 9759]